MVRTTTTSTDRRQRHRDERTAALLDRAMAIVEADGIDALTMPRLAAEADAAVGGLYRYFPSKEALIAGLQVRAARDLAAFLDERLDGVEGPLARVQAAFGTWAAWAERSPALYHLIDASLSDPRRLLDDADAWRVDDEVRPVLARCALVLEEAVAAGALAPGDGELRALTLWAALRGALQLRKRDRLQPPRLRADRVAQAVLDGLLAGWAAV